MAEPARVIERVETFAPRLMRRERAARYLDMSPSKFDQLVRDGRMPRGARVDGMVLWDRHALDSAADDLLDMGPREVVF